jgi:PKD domain
VLPSLRKKEDLVASKFLAIALIAFAAVVVVPSAAATGMSAVGAATPGSVPAGGSTLLTVTVVPGDDPPSSGIGVVCNLATIGGGLTLLHDDGTHGDAVPNDLTFSDLAVVDPGTAPGSVGIFCVVNDDQARTAFTTIPLTVTPPTVNEPPSVGAGGPYTVDEGGSVLLTATGVDPEGGSLSYAWDLDDNGTFETAGQTATFAADDGPATATIKVEVTDDGGLSAVGEASVTIANVAPTATFTAPTSASVGSPLELAASAPHDPSAADTAAGFAYAFDCGSGYGAFGSSPEASCTATGVGPQAVGAMIRDKDGGTTEYRATVDVHVTFDGLCELTAAYSSKPEIADALCVKLHHAAEAATAIVRNSLLDAYDNQVAAQTGKAFTAEQAEVLEHDADGLRA